MLFCAPPPHDHTHCHWHIIRMDYNGGKVFFTVQADFWKRKAWGPHKRSLLTTETNTSSLSLLYYQIPFLEKAIDLPFFASSVDIHYVLVHRNTIHSLSSYPKRVPKLMMVTNFSKPSYYLMMLLYGKQFLFFYFFGDVGWDTPLASSLSSFCIPFYI